MSLTVKGGTPKTIDLNDGLHKGKITKITKRTPDGKDYSYADFTIEVIGKNGELNVGYALPNLGEGVSPRSELGKLIARFTGSEVVKNVEYDLEKLFLEKEVQFVVLQNEKGYVEVQKGSVKLVQEVK